MEQRRHYHILYGLLCLIGLLVFSLLLTGCDAARSTTTSLTIDENGRVTEEIVEKQGKEDYTQEELTVKKHNFELEKSDSVILCVDAFQTGIGSNSCGPMLRDEYASPSDIAMHVTFSPFGVSE